MQKENEQLALYSVLKITKNLVPANFFTQHQRLFKEEEHLLKLAVNLTSFYTKGIPATPPPYFDKECTPALHQAYSFFNYSLEQWFKDQNSPLQTHAINFANALFQAQCKNILLLLGQRLTPGSLTDHQAIPPTRKTLLASATEIYKQDITTGARAWTKHASRGLNNFWGVPIGTTAVKNKAAFEKINFIISNTTWWNVFEHYSHKTVYEARIASGHGIRWGNEGKELIGFLEPFLEE